MTNHRRFEPLKRRVLFKSPRARVTIYTEGRKTEVDYLNQLRLYLGALPFELVVVGGVGVPHTIADRLIAEVNIARRQNRSQSYAKTDEFWAVFDRDEHPQVGGAIARCASANIQVAFSNPCFEVWLILHFQDYDRAEHRTQTQQKLTELCTKYDQYKSKTAEFAEYMTHLDTAEHRAEVQLCRRNQEGQPPGPPFTTFYELTRRLKFLAQQSS